MHTGKIRRGAVLLLLLTALAGIFLVPAAASVPEEFPKVFGGGLLIEAHRGFSDQYPENSLASFQAASEIAVFGGMETDVQLTKDNVLVCMHDSTLDRTTDGTGYVSDYTWDQLQQFHLDSGYGWSDAWAGQLTIPKLQDFLDICDASGKVPFIEIKSSNTAVTDRLLEVLDAGGWQGRCVIISFYLDALEYAASKTSEYPLEYMPASLTDEDAMLSRVAAMKTGILRLDYSFFSEELLEKCRNLGLSLETYTIGVGDDATLQRVLSYGVIGVTCNSYQNFTLSDDLMHIDRTEGLQHTEQQIVQKQLADLRISCRDAQYTGLPVEPAVTVTDPDTGADLIPGTDYEAVYADNTDAGTGTVTVTGLGDYVGAVETTFSIRRVKLAVISCSELPDAVYNGEEQCPEPQLTYQGLALQPDKDYTVEWSDNINAGTAAAVISGTGNFTGTLERSFEILPAEMGAVAVKLKADNLHADGTGQCPEAELTCGDLLLREGTDYTIRYVNNTEAGTAAAVFTGIGNFTGEFSENFTIGYPRWSCYLAAGALLALTVLILLLALGIWQPGMRKPRRKE